MSDACAVVRDGKTGIFYRQLHPGMGQAVAERTVLRKKDGEFETWLDVADRVAVGNCTLIPSSKFSDEVARNECYKLRNYIAIGTVLMSGRHLQHGDRQQSKRNMEVFTNCATAASSFRLFQILLNGSGVGRCYDDDMMLVNWDHAPTLRVVLDEDHPDYDYVAHESAREARHKYDGAGDTLWHEVADSREGWAKALELWEVAAFEKVHRDKMLILDFSKVRAKGQPIAGMQNRPASGPVPLMNAFMKASHIRGAGMKRWYQAMYIDHLFAECVLVGGARRAARIATKYWRDPDIIEFIEVKRPIEYRNMSMRRVINLRDEKEANGERPPAAFLWTANNSVAVDDKFWSESKQKGSRAAKILRRIAECQYGDGTGEPGILNVHKIKQDDGGWDQITGITNNNSQTYICEENTHLYFDRLSKRARKKRYHMIVNPCGEIVLCLLGAFCVIGDLVPFHARPRWGAREGTWYDEKVERFRAEWDANFEDAARTMTRALLRVNLMDSVYNDEVRRTNRIGVGLTGVHEYAWERFGLGFRDLLDEFGAGAPFWKQLAKVSRAVVDEMWTYSELLKMPPPHTGLTMKPSGTMSKLFGLTEAAHLPAMARFVRWVQFQNDDPLVETYRERGYPVRKLEHYQGHTIVGFPTQPVIDSLDMGDKLVLAGDATPEEQYRWLMLLEKYWLRGFDQGTKCYPLFDYGNQISYTLKYKPEDTPFSKYFAMLRRYQPEIKACSVMPQIRTTAYEYQPEEGVTEAEYEQICRSIKGGLSEDIGAEHLDCDGGMCPTTFADVKGEAHEEGLSFGT